MIKNCRSCSSKKLTNILNLGNQYLSDFIDANEPKPERHPLKLVLCENCTLLQLADTTPPSSLYHNRYGYYSGINTTMKNHLKEIIEEAMSRVKLHMEDVVVDIGSNDGTLLKNYPQELIRIGFDPIEKFGKNYKGVNFVFVNHFFSADIFFQILKGTIHRGKKAKIITAISMFYDLDDPNTFVSDLVKVLDNEGVLIIQQNYVGSMLKQNAFDNVVHEHLEYYSLTSLSKLLNKHYLEVVDVETNDLNGGSFRVYVKHMDNVKKLRLMEQKMKLDNKWTYALFGMRIKNIKHKLMDFIKREVEKGKTIYLYGASTRGNTMLQYCGLDNTLIKAAVERNPDKWGKKIASVDIPIISEEQARKEKPDYFLVCPWFFKEEIIKREENYIKNGGTLLFPLPELYVVNKDNYSDALDKN